MKNKTKLFVKRLIMIIIMISSSLLIVGVTNAQQYPGPVTRTDPNGGAGGYWSGQTAGTNSCFGCGNSGVYGTRANTQRPKYNNTCSFGCGSNNYPQNYNYNNYGYSQDYSNYGYSKPWGMGKMLLYNAASEGIADGIGYLFQRQLIKDAAKEQRKSEELGYKRQMELLQMQINAQQQYQQQVQQAPPQQQQQMQVQSGPVQEPVSWTRISVTNCLPAGVQLFWNDQPIYFNDSATLLSMHRVAIEVPAVPGVIVVVQNGTAIRNFELYSGLTSLVIR